MTSILDQLNSLRMREDDSVSKTLATTLYENFKDKNFLSINQLAKECFVSMSTITAFCKRLGYSGYKELLFTIKMAVHEYGDKKPQSANQLSDAGLRIRDALASFGEDESNLKNISESIINSKRIYIFSSYQVAETVSIFVESLSMLKDFIIFNKTTIYSFRQVNKIEEYDMAIFFLIGPDTKSIKNIYINTLKRTKNIVVFTSESQKSFCDELSTNVVVDSKLLSPTIFNRSIILNYMFQIIYDNILIK